MELLSWKGCDMWILLDLHHVYEELMSVQLIDQARCPMFYSIIWVGFSADMMERD